MSATTASCCTPRPHTPAVGPQPCLTLACSFPKQGCLALNSNCPFPKMYAWSFRGVDWTKSIFLLIHVAITSPAPTTSALQFCVAACGIVCRGCGCVGTCPILLGLLSLPGWQMSIHWIASNLGEGATQVCFLIAQVASVVLLHYRLLPVSSPLFEMYSWHVLFCVYTWKGVISSAFCLLLLSALRDSATGQLGVRRIGHLHLVC